MYQHILVLLENSEADKTILEHIRNLARLTKSKMSLLHVADGFVARTRERLNLSDSKEIQEDRAYIKRRCEELQKDDFDVQPALLFGEPSDQIVAYAEREHCDLIAMATHGHRYLADLFFGSVASNIRHRTDIPILMVRSKKG